MGGDYFASILKQKAPNVLRKLVSCGTKFIFKLSNKLAKLPKFGKRAAKIIENFTPRNLFIKLLSGSVNKFVSILPNLDMCLSAGGFIAGMWDYFSDKKLNGIVRI